MSVAPVEQIRFIGLQWAKLSRAILCGGLCLTFRDEVGGVHVRNWGYRNWLVAFISLAGMYMQSTHLYDDY